MQLSGSQMWASHWEVTTVRVQPGVVSDKTRLDDFLQLLWEPFSVTWGDGCFVYHLKRMTTEKEPKKAPEIKTSKRGY